MPVMASEAGSRFDARKRHDVIAMCLAARERAVAAHLDEHGGDFEQRVGLRVEAAGLDVDHHRQEAAKARGEGDGWKLRHASAGPGARRRIRRRDRAPRVPLAEFVGLGRRSRPP